MANEIRFSAQADEDLNNLRESLLQQLPVAAALDVLSALRQAIHTVADHPLAGHTVFDDLLSWSGERFKILYSRRDNGIQINRIVDQSAPAPTMRRRYVPESPDGIQLAKGNRPSSRRTKRVG